MRRLMGHLPGLNVASVTPAGNRSTGRRSPGETIASKAGTVFGRCEAKTGIAPFERLVAQVMRHEPCRVFWIVDNGSGHRGHPAVARLQARWPQATLVHTPIHASWLD